MKIIKKKLEEKRRLGEFEEIVLVAILSLADNAYGVTVRRWIEVETDRHPSFGALYTTFDRLEKKGYISSRQGGATTERGGRAKRYLTVENVGREALKSRYQVRSKMFASLQPELV
ncbi:MAG TPA: helix-turn-helix transcriptional regulator [Pyrinomonadaceae bacterium]|jgi:DNA-binding PadR family transcriptional regulator|nr:helix-turn-helix transcriptional regulator [Pyrinomonadaceae bacterium]